MSTFGKKRGRPEIQCHDCHKFVSGSINHHHRNECSAKKTTSRSKKCYDCGKEVTGDFHTHHQNECEKSKKNKSTVDFNIVSKSSQASQVSQIPHPPQSLSNFSDSNDVYFLIDVSGSMEGKKLDTAKETMKQMAESMNNRDRIAVVTFDKDPFFKLKPRPVEQVLRQNELSGLLDRIFSKGMTSLYDAVYMAISQLRSKEITTIMNVLTDGEDNSSKHSLNEVLLLLNQYPNLKLNILYISNNGDKDIKEYSTMCKDRGTYQNITYDNIDKIPSIVVNIYKSIIIELKLQPS